MNTLKMIGKTSGGVLLGFLFLFLWIMAIGFFMTFLKIPIASVLTGAGSWLYLTGIFCIGYLFTAGSLYILWFRMIPYGKRKAMFWFFLLFSIHPAIKSGTYINDFMLSLRIP